MQSVAVLDTRTGKVTDYPDTRTLVESKQVLFSGLAFSCGWKDAVRDDCVGNGSAGEERAMTRVPGCRCTGLRKED